jgi:hypothetical protein
VNKPQSNQEVFDTVIAHLRQQGVRAVGTCNAGPTCAYRGQNGTKCAVGVLLPDALYDPRMEGFDIEMLYEDFPKVIEHFSNVNMALLRELQCVHDNYLPDEASEITANFERQAQLVAAEFGLTYTAPEGATA